MDVRNVDQQMPFFERPEVEAAIAGMADSGKFKELSELTILKIFITSFAGHITAEAAR